MPTTYSFIQKVSVGSGGSAAIEFTAIPQTYTDLLLALSVRYSAGGLNGGYGLLRFNADTASNYYYQWLRADMTTVSSSNNSNASFIIVTNNGCTNSNSASTFSSSEIYIPSYTGSSNKEFYEYHCSENSGSTSTYINLSANNWASSSAISSIKIDGGSGNFLQYSTATLYGIKNS